jgi:hypothetical protein
MFSKHDILHFGWPDMSYKWQSSTEKKLPCITLKRIKNIFSKHDILHFDRPDMHVISKLNIPKSTKNTMIKAILFIIYTPKME